MIAHERSPYIYGEILSSSLCRSPQHELPGFGRFVSQGIFVGVFVFFLLPVIGMLSNPENGYNFLFISWLPIFLVTGMGFGLFEGLVLWACCYIAGHRLNAVARAGLGTVILATLVVSYDYFWAVGFFQHGPSLREWLVLIAACTVVGAVFGLVSGSKFSPVSELLRGTTPPRWLILNGITGLLLRVPIIYAMMASTLILIWFRQIENHQREFGFAAISLGHFMAAIVILFTRMPFWLLLLLALLINFPVVLLITEVLTEDQIALRNFVIAYLTLWTAFLLCRVSVPHTVLSSVKKEIRYYLID